MCYVFSKKNLYEGKIEETWSEDFHQNLNFCSIFIFSSSDIVDPFKV